MTSPFRRTAILYWSLCWIDLLLFLDIYFFLYGWTYFDFSFSPGTVGSVYNFAPSGFFVTFSHIFIF